MTPAPPSRGSLTRRRLAWAMVITMAAGLPLFIYLALRHYTWMLVQLLVVLAMARWAGRELVAPAPHSKR